MTAPGPEPDWRQIAADLAWAQTGEPHSPAEQEALDAYDQAVGYETRAATDAALAAMARPAGEDGNP